MATFPYTSFPDSAPYPVINLGTATVNVSSSAALTTALANAAPGQQIVLANATYSGAFTLSGKSGTSANPISVEAASTGGAVFASGSTFLVNNCTYVTLKGLSFPFELTAGGNIVAFRGSGRYCRVTRCLFGPTALSTAGSTKATYIYGGDDVEYIRVDHNELRYKTQPGNQILFDGNFTSYQACRHIRIDHNYIHHSGPEASNEKEPVRLGVSTMSKTWSYSVIERNRFEANIAEPEIVSVKACGVRVSGNTFWRNIGGPVYRHGTDGVMSDNYVIDASTGGGDGGTPGGITSTEISTIVMLTQAQYDALGTKDAHTLYYTTTTGGTAATSKQITSTAVTKVVALTSTQYNSLAIKDAATLYVIAGLIPSTIASTSITSTTVDTIVKLTAAEYNALGTVNQRTLYIISG